MLFRLFIKSRFDAWDRFVYWIFFSLFLKKKKLIFILYHTFLGFYSILQLLGAFTIYFKILAVFKPIIKKTFCSFLALSLQLTRQNGIFTRSAKFSAFCHTDIVLGKLLQFSFTENVESKLLFHSMLPAFHQQLSNKHFVTRHKKSSYLNCLNC